MKKIKNILILIITLVLIGGIILGINKSLAWPVRFKRELNQFFGKGNWEAISEETKESIIYDEYHYLTNDPSGGYETSGKYKNWYIKFKNKNSEDEVWQITNHSYKINNDKYSFLSSKRLSNKQALGMELMEISFQVIGDKVKEEILSDFLTEKQIECLKVEMSYSNGNPEPKFYSNLFNQSWFKVNDIDAKNYLELDAHKFYIAILAYDYKLEKLTEDERKDMFNNLQEIENKLLEEYGDVASFEINFNSDYKVKYVAGVKE